MSITDQKGAMANTYLTGTVGVPVSPGGTYTSLGLEASVFRFYPTVKVRTLQIVDIKMTNVYYVENSACSA